MDDDTTEELEEAQQELKAREDKMNNRRLWSQPHSSHSSPTPPLRKEQLDQPRLL